MDARGLKFDMVSGIQIILPMTAEERKRRDKDKEEKEKARKLKEQKEKETADRAESEMKELLKIKDVSSCIYVTLHGKTRLKADILQIEIL